MNDKTRNLLEKAERQSQSSESRESSVASASCALADSEAAEILFKQLKRKLFRVEKWNDESLLTGFKLFDTNGIAVGEKTAAVGDFIRLSLIGSGKYDWIKIVEITDESNEAIVTVQPSYNPTENQPDKNTTSHFFSGDSFNNFCLARTAETVSVYVIGLNEKTNTDATENLLETVRNIAVANIGSYSGIQTGEWKKFCENFLK